MREQAYRTEKQMLNRIEELEGVSCRALSRVRGLEAEVERLKNILREAYHDCDMQHWTDYPEWMGRAEEELAEGKL